MQKKLIMLGVLLGLYICFNREICIDGYVIEDVEDLQQYVLFKDVVVEEGILPKEKVFELFNSSYINDISETVVNCDELLYSDNVYDELLNTSTPEGVDSLKNGKIYTISVERNITGSRVKMIDEGQYPQDREPMLQKWLKTVKLQLGKDFSTDLEKIEAVTKYICDYVSYDYSYNSLGNLVDTFIKKETICTGYSLLFQQFMMMYDIESRVVVGKTDEDILHAWNMVKVEDTWYYIDVCFIDTLYFDDLYLSNYFLCGKRDFEVTHKVSNIHKRTIQGYEVSKRDYFQ